MTETGRFLRGKRVAEARKQPRHVTLQDGKQHVKFKQRHLRTEGDSLSALIYVALVLPRLPPSVLTSLGKLEQCTQLALSH